jgi:hypothetical protein
MPIKLSAALLALIILAGAIVGAVKLGQAVTTERNGWDLFDRVEVTSDPVLIEPSDLLLKTLPEDVDPVEQGLAYEETMLNLLNVVNEARDYGIPFSVHVITDEGIDAERSANEVAAERYADAPVETSDGADDGLLMLVIVTEPDLTETRVGFATGANFYPLGGITPDRLTYIADVQMQALIDEGRIGDAVIEGATWVEWTQLFEPTPNDPPDELQSGLHDLLAPWGALLFGGLAALALIAAVGTQALTWRGTSATVTLDAPDAITMGAIARGRVDRAVLAGAVLDAVDRGSIVLDQDNRLRAGGAAPTARDALLLDAIGAIEARGGTPTPAALGRYLSEDGAVRRAMEDQLATAGALDRRSPVLTVWLRGIAAAGVILGVAGLVLSILGEAATSLAAAIALTAISLVVLIWNEQRSWATRAGRAALRDWEEAHRSPDDRDSALYDAITGMDTIDLRPASRSPLRPDAQELAASLAL